MSNSSIVSVRELIDTAFGESELNVVNFKLIQTILYLLARQLRILERQVGIKFGSWVVPTASSLSITEVKLQATVPKRKRKLVKHESGTTSTNRNGPTTGQDKKNKLMNKDKSSETPSSKSTTEKSTTDKISSKSTTDETTTAEVSSSLKTTTTPSSSEKTKSSSDKTKSSTGKSTSTKESSDKTTGEGIKKRDYQLLELIEQQREQELRVVNQRADSREVAEKTPTPMASLESMEVQFEKLLIVERVPVEEADKKIGRLRDGKQGKLPKLTVVTQNEFDELAQSVKELQKKFGVVGKPDFPENIELMKDLRRGASLTDAMAALQLSARLEAAEKTLKNMTTLITNLAVSKGIDITEEKEIGDEAPETKVIFPSGSSKASRKPGGGIKKSTQTKKRESDDIPIYLSSDAPLIDTEEAITDLEDLPKLSPECINITELNEAMQEVYDNLIKAFGNVTNKATSNAEDALKIARRIEGKLDATIGLDTRMNNLEMLVSEYAGQINTLDTNLSSQMTSYQEQLTQMQHDLEGGLEAMAEALANPPGETAGVAELNANFNNLHVEFDIANMRQKDLKEHQEQLSVDVEALWKEIELLREIKSDREEVADALRDKAGLCALNGLVTQQQFDAVRGDFEKRIGASYDKFNNQEIVWQKAIDDLLRELNEKADWLQIAALRDDVNNNLVHLQNKIHDMLEIIGEPRAATISKQLFRDAACLSCSTPAQMNLEVPSIPALPAFSKTSSRPPTIGAENTTKPKEDGDHGLCYHGQKIPHARDPRSHFCQRYCGGSHTALRNTLPRAPVGMIISKLRSENTGIDFDDKVEKSDRQKQPCMPCNVKKVSTPLPLETDRDTPGYEFSSEMTRFYTLPQAIDSVSVTPPFPLDEDL